MRLEMPYSLLVAINDSSTKLFHAATPFVTTEDLLFAWPEFVQMASQTNFRAVAAVQVANDIYVPGLVTEIGAALTADGTNFGVRLDLATAIANARWARFGWNVWVNSGGAPPLFGRCGGHVDLIRGRP